MLKNDQQVLYQILNEHGHWAIILLDAYRDVAVEERSHIIPDRGA